MAVGLETEINVVGAISAGLSRSFSPEVQRSMRNGCLTLFFLLLHCAFLGCDGRRNELLSRLKGTWEVDLEMTEPELVKEIADASVRWPDMDAEHIYQLKMDGYRARRIVVTETTFKDHRSGGVVEEQRYSVMRSGDNYLILRKYDDERHPQYSSMSLRDIVAQGGVSGGPVPFCIGVEFVDDEHFVLFTLRIRDNELTYERNYAIPIFRRVQDNAHAADESGSVSNTAQGGEESPVSSND
jgi:hypothetical protein